MQTVCSTQTPSYHKGKILTDSKNSVPAEGPVWLDHSKLPPCPGSVKACTLGQMLRDLRQSCLSLLVKTVSASQNCTCARAGVIAVAHRNLPLYLPVHQDFLCLAP